MNTAISLPNTRLPLSEERENRLLRLAFLLALVTVIYNLAEGLISVYFGAADDSLSLLGFGVDSFVEVISGVGIAHMVYRLKRGAVNERDGFERTALRITGIGFYVLTAGLIVGSLFSVLQGRAPSTTIPGVIIAIVSIATMYFLMTVKLRTGRALQSDPIIADANCTKTCFYLSIILLASSGLYEFFGIGYFDAAGSLGIAWFAFREGRECFEKIRKNTLACCDDCHT